MTFIYKNSPLVISDNSINTNDILMEFNGEKIDRYGTIDTHTSMGKMDIDSYIMRCKHNLKIDIKFFSVRKQKIMSSYVIFKNECNYAISDIQFPTKIKYIDVGGVIICELTINHIVDLISNSNITIVNTAHMYNYLLEENRESPVIFISKILQDLRVLRMIILIFVKALLYEK